jgi:hypothetical protein
MYQSNLTVEEIFRFTPPQNAIIDRVVYKIKSGSQTLNIFGPTVYDHITVNKFVYIEYVCYMISLVVEEKFTFENLAVTPVGSGLIYRLDFGEALKDVQYLKLSFTRFRGDYPIRSILINPVIRRKFFDANDREAWTYNLFTSYYYRLHAINLPSPYETRCFDYKRIGFDHDVDCAQNCTRSMTLKEIGKNPYSVIIREPNNMSMVSYDDMSGVIGKRILEIEKGCQHLCRYRPCDDGRTLTIAEAKQARRFQLDNVLPIYPSIETKAHEQLSFVEFITYLVSTISTWTGLSIVSLNRLMNILFWWKKCNKRKTSQMDYENHKRQSLRLSSQRMELKKVTGYLNTQCKKADPNFGKVAL